MNIKGALLKLEIQTKSNRKDKPVAQHIYVDFIFSQSDSFAYKKQFILIEQFGEILSSFVLVAALLDANLSAKGKNVFLYQYRTFSTGRFIT